MGRLPAPRHERETTYGSAIAHFSRSPTAARKLQEWRARPGKAPVVAFAENLTSAALYSISPAAVEETCQATRHALAWPDGRGLRRSVGERVAEVADWYPNFPLVHTFYYA